MRETNGLSRSEIASRMGISRQTIFRWEKGENEPDDQTKKDLAKLLKTNIAYLMGEIDDPSPVDASKDNSQVLRNIREGTGLSLSEASAFLEIEEGDLQKIEEGTILLGAKDKKRIIRAYSNYLADEDEEEEGQGLTPIQGGGLCGSEGSELSEVIKALAKDSLIRKSVRMMEDLTEEEKYKVFQYIQDQEYIARTKGKREA
nr:helix-turn-helix domain-containing protein [uncultured Dethiosulfovibrio sp.]